MSEAQAGETMDLPDAWIDNVPGNAAIQPAAGASVEVQVHGDEEIYQGICVKPRKLWVELRWYPVPDFVADESSIRRWRPVPPPCNCAACCAARRAAACPKCGYPRVVGDPRGWYPHGVYPAGGPCPLCERDQPPALSRATLRPAHFFAEIAGGGAIQDGDLDECFALLRLAERAANRQGIYEGTLDAARPVMARTAEESEFYAAVSSGRFRAARKALKRAAGQARS